MSKVSTLPRNDDGTLPRNDDGTLPRNDDGTLQSYAWPGGYPIYYIDSNNSVLCPDCARAEESSKAQIFTITAADVNYENDDLYCDECSKRIESAYGPSDPVEAQVIPESTL
jgi:hypothetical protein